MRYPWIFFFASTVHILWGIGALVDENVRSNSFLHDVSRLAQDNTVAMGMLFIVVGILPILGHRIRNSRGMWSLVLALPQQFFLVLAAWGFTHNLWVSSVPEVDAILPRGVIFPATVVAVCAAFWHTVALVDYYIWPKRGK